ncbi:phospholipase D/nuclease [Lojkania enalia]|uniref:Phospholipase D/nuclease n=1 Tax=Lojkania enalia TaxID=147567 RepID=A0A9P4K0Q8_9PLEO|nr:phospholipase D/nuclease [Didymosphaeria enalia]
MVGGSPPNKRQKVAPDQATSAITDNAIAELSVLAHQKTIPKGLSRPISPPASRRARSVTPSPSISRARASKVASLANEDGERDDGSQKYLPSPIQLTRIKNLSPTANVDTVGLGDILGDPMIRECWNFNFLFDLDFVLGKFDQDVRKLIKLRIVHGFWRRDDERRKNLQEAVDRYTEEGYSNIGLISAYMPDPFGTHHSKMLILLRHDEQAQVVIHTANMISRDWGNMTQAVWRSPFLPLENQTTTRLRSQVEPQIHPIGSGNRFKTDLLQYLNAYGSRLKDLTKELVKYDFSSIRAAFVASAPTRQKSRDAKPAKQTSWGWLGLREILSSIPIAQIEENKSASNIVIQISSIATLGQTPAWLHHFQSVLSHSSSPTSSPPNPHIIFQKPETRVKSKSPDPSFNIIFPTPHEIRTSLDGYASGFSIHTKISSPAQQRQLQYLYPLLCHWSHTFPRTLTADPAKNPQPSTQQRNAHRGPAAPHIKTYIRFANSTHSRIDWALITSANLSKQAWGETENKKGEVWIQSWECGVVVWPALFREADEGVVMVPVFGRDAPGEEDRVEFREESKEKKVWERGVDKLVGLRMPYDLPLSPYREGEVPWCASLVHEEPDWRGLSWEGY